MPGSMLVHDRRVVGRTPRLAENAYVVDKKTSLKHAMDWVAWYARSKQGLSDLFVIAHGISEWSDDDGHSRSGVVLGFGMLLCAENLTCQTIGATSALRGLVDTITLYACGVAHTRLGAEGTCSDGWRFCRELSAITNAEVIASVSIQSYATRSPWYARGTKLENGTIDLGPWEGKVYRFSPNGSVMSSDT